MSAYQEVTDFTEALHCGICNDILGEYHYTPATGQVKALCAVCAERNAIVRVTK